MRATGLLEDESYKQIAQAFDDVSGQAITAVQPYLEDLIQKVERGEIDPNDTLVVAAGSLGAALLTASKKDRVRIIKATRSPFTRLIDAVKRKAQGPKTAQSAKGQVDNGPAPNSKQTPGGATNLLDDKEEVEKLLAKTGQFAKDVLKVVQPFRPKRAVPRVHPDVDPPEAPLLYNDLSSKAFKNMDGVSDMITVKPGKPGTGSQVGTPGVIRERNSPDHKRQLVRERDSASILEEAGYKIEHQPEVTLADGLDLNKKPDYRINGVIYDCYAPHTNSTRAIWAYIKDKKIEEQQTKRVVLNLTDTSVTVEQIIQQLRAFPITGLEDLIIIK
jgi:hypothetical protein